MSVVVYKCDTCKREIELPQNKQGIEVVGRCIITSNCKGSLVQEAVKASYVRGKLPPEDPTGLQDWTPRRVFYNHNQTIASKKWTIDHNLGTNPSVQVYVYTVDNHLVETTPLSVTYTNPYQAVVEFHDSLTGVAQCVARSTATQSQITPKYVETSVVAPLTITGGDILTIATLSTEAEITLHAQFISPIFFTQTAELEFDFISSEPSFLSPWRNTHKLFINGKLYTVRTAVVNSTILNSNIDPASPFYFSYVTTQGLTVPVGGDHTNRIRQGDIFVLLSTDPYESTDRTLTKVFDITDIDSANVVASSYQSEGNLYINDNIPRSVYPAIKIVN